MVVIPCAAVPAPVEKAMALRERSHSHEKALDTDVLAIGWCRLWFGVSDEISRCEVRGAETHGTEGSRRNHRKSQPHGCPDLAQWHRHRPGVQYGHRASSRRRLP